MANTNGLTQVGTGVPMINGDVMRMTNGGVLLPYIAESIYCNYGKNFFTTFAEMWMDKRYDASTEIYHVEESPQIYTVRATADATAAGPGQPITVSYANNIAGLAPVQKGFFAAFPPLGKMGKITNVSVNAKTFTVEPNDIQYTLSIKAGQDVIIAPAAVVAACSCDVFPGSVKTPGLMYKSQMMTIKKNLRICGEDLAQWLSNRWLFPLKSITDPCEDIEVWWHGDLDLMWFEFTYAKQIFAMLGEDITNNSANFTGLKSTTGIIHMLRARATQEPVPASVGITMDYFKRIAAKTKTMRNSCKEYGVWSGYEHRSEIDTALEGKVIKNDCCESWNFLAGDKPRGIRFGFDAIKIDGVEFYLHDEDSLNDPGFLGAAGFTGPTTTFMVPLCKLPCGNGMATAFIMRYLSGNGVNRELIENDYGILRPGSNHSDCDWHEWSLMSQFGIDAYCMQNFIWTESI